MVKCKVCNFESDDLTIHIKEIHNLSVEDYKKNYPYCKLIQQYYKRTCIFCNKTWMNKQNQGKYCSTQCKNSHHKTLQATEDCIECKMCNYAALDLSAHIRKVHKITIENYKKRYNVERVVSKKVANKRKSSQLETYKIIGAPTSWNKDLTKETDDRLKRIGESISIAVSRPEIKLRKELTCLKKYGVKHHNQSRTVQDKRRSTCIEKYNVDNYSKSKHYRHKYIQKQIDTLLFCKMLDSYDYNSKYDKFYNFKCELCNNTFSARFDRQYDIKCPKCYNKYKTIKEGEIKQFVRGLGLSIVDNDRSKIKAENSNAKLEIDIYIPEKKVGIEFNGNTWHTTQHKSKTFHLHKTTECEKQDIQLIHIFEDEWDNKKEIIKSRLKAIFKYNVDTIFGRKCKIVSVATKEERLFLDNNHLQGYVASNYCYGLKYNDELVSLMSFREKRYGIGNLKKNSIELLRFSNKLNTKVIGAASKLFKHFLKASNYKKIISYADRRWSLGGMYNKLGFSHSHNSPPNYWYVQTGKSTKRHNRINFQKHKLINNLEDKHKTEQELAALKGFYQIYDSGNMVFEYEVKQENDKTQS